MSGFLDISFVRSNSKRDRELLFREVAANMTFLLIYEVATFFHQGHTIRQSRCSLTLLLDTGV